MCIPAQFDWVCWKYFVLACSVSLEVDTRYQSRPSSPAIRVAVRRVQGRRGRAWCPVGLLVVGWGAHDMSTCEPWEG